MAVGAPGGFGAFEGGIEGDADHGGDEEPFPSGSEAAVLTDLANGYVSDLP